MTFRIGVIEGDGVGPEVVRWGVETLVAAGHAASIKFEFVNAPVHGISRVTPP